MQLGDAVERALHLVGVTPERVRRVLGNCRCDERREALNQWSKRVLAGRMERAREFLEKLL